MANYYILSSDGELYHYGVKGQKWGVRRYQKKDGSLTSAGKKRYKTTGNDETLLDRDRAKAAKQLASAKTARGKRKAQEKVDRLAKAEPKAYAAAHSPKMKVETAMLKIGGLYLTDQMFNGGRGIRAAKNAIKGVGMLTISAIAKARGATDIHWYDEYGRKIV